MSYLNSQLTLIKNSNKPYYPTTSTIKNITSENDHFPYSRYFTGDFNSNEVKFFDRMAGYSKSINLLYKRPVYHPKPVKLEYCFQEPVAVTYRCVDNEPREYIPIVPPQ